MGQLLQFRPRAMPPPAPARTVEDDDHEAATWMGIAEWWGWNVKEFRVPGHDLTGYLLFHDAQGMDTPLYTLVRAGTVWRRWNCHRELAEFDTLGEALQSVFPTELTQSGRG